MLFASSFPEREGKTKMKNVLKVYSSWRGEEEILCSRGAVINREQVNPCSKMSLPRNTANAA